MQSLYDEKHANGKLQGKIVLITGDDLDKGRDVAICFARDGAAIILNYKPPETRERITSLPTTHPERARLR